MSASRRRKIEIPTWSDFKLSVLVTNGHRPSAEGFDVPATPASSASLAHNDTSFHGVPILEKPKPTGKNSRFNQEAGPQA